MRSLQLVSEWETDGDLRDNAIDAVGRGDDAVLAFEFDIAEHDGEVNIRAQITIEDSSGRLVDDFTDYESRLVDADGSVTMEWAYLTPARDWSTGTYTAEVLVQDTTTGETSGAASHKFDVVEPLGEGEAEVYYAEPDTVTESETFDVEVGLRNISDRDSSVVSDISYRENTQEGWKIWEREAIALTIPGGNAERTWRDSGWSISDSGDYQFRFDAIDDDFVVDVKAE